MYLVIAGGVIVVLVLILFFVFKKPKTIATTMGLPGQYLAKLKANIYYSDKADDLNYVYRVDGSRVKNQKDKFFWG